MKLVEEIKGYRKEFVYEQYIRIIDDCKSYPNITKVKMIEAIIKFYEDYHNIIEICTTRELKVLKMCLDNDSKFMEDIYKWERDNLRDKFLIMYDFEKYVICEELDKKIEEALDNVDWKLTKKKDKINEFMVSFCKIQGSGLIQPLIEVSSAILNISSEELTHHIFENKLFKYYVSITYKDFESIREDVPIFVFNEYFYLLEDLEEQRKIQGLAPCGQIKLEDYKCLFYNDFNINNPVIKKFYDELIALPFFYQQAIKLVKEFSLLNIDREILKDAIRNVPVLEDYDLNDFFKLMDKAMDEMPSGALNGLTPNEAKLVKEEKLKEQVNKIKKYQKQKDACLDYKEAKLFYKLYFGILDYTNQKYNIKPHYKIYNKINLNPYDIVDVIEKFWEEKDKIIFEFCINNPFKFTKDEIDMVKEFRKGIRDTFVIVEYLEEYTAIMNAEKIYMIKGLYSNIDEVVPFEQLPHMTVTSIIPFNGKLIYDGLFLSYGITFDNGFNKAVENDYKRLMKYYHL